MLFKGNRIESASQDFAQLKLAYLMDILSEQFHKMSNWILQMSTNKNCSKMRHPACGQNINVEELLMTWLYQDLAM